jgi:serine/tyrosine/threonine adenylyltransferase
VPVSSRYRPDPRFLELGEGFADVVAPARFPRHELRFRNQRWAERAGLGSLDEAEWERKFARFEALPENLPAPLALRYHGHQFRTYNPDLGDGRGFLFAQLRDDRGRLLDLATKGSGQTPWSRSGDGRLTLKGGVREVLATEMLEALGVYTSKSFSLYETGESLQRNDEPSPTRSSVLVRLGHSHIRFGSFQRHLVLRDHDRIARLLDHCVEHYASEIARGAADTPTAFLALVAERSLQLAATWLAAGFVHGVLNTDNMNVTGESFDYGPWRFLPTYDLDFTAAYFDQTGLYSFGRQPDAVLWNLTRLAEALSPLTPVEGLVGVLRDFGPRFIRAYAERVLARLGLVPLGDDRDADFLSLFRAFATESGIGHDQLFFDWYAGSASTARAASSPAAVKYTGPTWLALRRALDGYAPADPARLEDPYFARERPCTMLIDEVEALWDPIAERDDWGPFAQKIADVRAMGAALALTPPVARLDRSPEDASGVEAPGA